ncbi:MAG: hypothetical protein AB199_02020 [Parcubacteria bacterium C7867-004]|nr:MAG: hypothetical protein AB199_02020 [Parcubacteria bacterium C7867-004]
MTTNRKKRILPIALTAFAVLLVGLFLLIETNPYLYAIVHDLKTYRNTEYGIEFSYPKEFYLSMEGTYESLDPATHNLEALNAGLDADASASANKYMFGTITALTDVSTTSQREQLERKEVQHAAPIGDVSDSIKGLSPETHEDRLLERIVPSWGGKLYLTAWRMYYGYYETETPRSIDFDLSAYNTNGDNLFIAISPLGLNENALGEDQVVKNFSSRDARFSPYWNALLDIAHTYRTFTPSSK